MDSWGFSQRAAGDRAVSLRHQGSGVIRGGTSLSDATGLRRVVDLPTDLGDFTDDERRQIQRFLAWAKRRGAESSYIARHRRTWWSVKLRDLGGLSFLPTWLVARQRSFETCAVPVISTLPTASILAIPCPHRYLMYSLRGFNTTYAYPPGARTLADSLSSSQGSLNGFRSRHWKNCMSEPRRWTLAEPDARRGGSKSTVSTTAS